MKILGVVVLYYPDGDVTSNISSYIDMLDALIIWDNTTEKEREKTPLIELISTTPVIFMSEGKNVGVGRALNKAVNYAIENAYTHLLTMDQDSRFDENNFSKYIQNIRESKDESVMAYCVNASSELGSKGSESVEIFITSGTILPTTIFKRIGTFREDFFIDAIDTEYSFRIRKNNYGILKYNDVYMRHQLGNPTIKPFLWGKLISPNYSATRTYYLVRNHIVLRKLYGKEYVFSKGQFKTIFFWRPICIIFAEKDKLKKCICFLRGIYDGFRMKTGMLE